MERGRILASDAYNFQKLTPINKADLNVYKEAMDYVFNNVDVKNVGISGAYSAGKSSVIATYKEENPDIKFLHISLAYFQSATQIDILQHEQNENILEGKILNQLIHQIDPIKIPQTNFRVKRHLSSKKLWLTATLISLFIILWVYIFNFSRWCSYIPTLSPQFAKDILSITITPFFALFAGVVNVAILFFFILVVTKVQFNKNLFKGISVQGNTIEIFEQSEESYFDKYLNEVLYLFENSGAEVIVFEDMDRYNTNQIFQRLREINTLINNRRKSTNKPLRFFYLLRDDIFVSKERTKFFDFIMPIVPILDGSNSFDQFIEHFKNGNILQLFDEHFLQEISLYIDDMRILKNIYNEFIVYYKRISTTEQDPNKLLAIIIYKNIFPRDFSDLQLNSGFVYTLFRKKEEFIKDEIDHLRNKILVLNQTIELSEKEHLNNDLEVDLIYNPQIDKIRNYYGSNSQMDQLVLERDKRKVNIKNKSNDQRIAALSNINLLESSIVTIQNKKLSEILNKQNASNIFQATSINEIGVVSTYDEIKGSDYFDLIKYLIKNGYIDETYPDYMTYFYENSLSRIDKIFLRSVTDEEAKDYTYHLKSSEMVVARLSVANFDKEEILNFDLLGYLLKHQKGANKDKMLRIFKQIKERKLLKFVSLFLDTGNQEEVALFIQHLNHIWAPVFKEIQYDNYFSEIQKKTYALKSMYYSPKEDLVIVNLECKLSEFVANIKDFLNISNPEIVCLVDAFNLLNIKFKDIDYEISNKELFNAVYEGNFYIISFRLVCLMLQVVYGENDSKELKHKNYTLVLNQPNEPIVKYVQENIVEYIQVVLENCEYEISDSEETVIRVLNDSKLELESKVTYISYLKTHVSKLQVIESTELWSDLLSKHILVYSENNVLQYFFRSGYGLDDCLVDFINNQSNSFNFDYSEIDKGFGEGEGSKYFNAIVRCNELNTSAYANILKSLNRVFGSFNITGISNAKIDVLVEQGRITMKPEVLAFMRENYTEKRIPFIVRNIQKYIEDVISQENFDFNEMIEILETEVDDQHKIALIKYTELPISVHSGRYSEALKAYIIQNNFMQEDIQLLLKKYLSFGEDLQSSINSLVMTYLDYIIDNEFFIPYQLCERILLMSSFNLDDKIRLFTLVLKDLNETQSKKCLVILNLENFLSVFNGKRPTIPVTGSNQLILDIFLRKRWIVGYDLDKKDESVYRVSSRRVTKQKVLPTELL